MNLANQILESIIGSKIDSKLEEIYYEKENFEITDEMERKVNTVFRSLVNDEFIKNTKLLVKDSSDCYAIVHNFQDFEIQLGSAVLNRLDTDKEYAFVIGHEIGHILCMHQLKNEALPKISSIANKYYIYNNEVDTILMNMTRRQDELESDAVALYLVNKANYNLTLDEMPQLFYKMAGDRYMSSDKLRVISHHPSIATRICALARYSVSDELLKNFRDFNMEFVRFNGSSTEAKILESILKQRAEDVMVTSSSEFREKLDRILKHSEINKDSFMDYTGVKDVIKEFKEQDKNTYSFSHDSAMYFYENYQLAKDTLSAIKKKMPITERLKLLLEEKRGFSNGC